MEGILEIVLRPTTMTRPATALGHTDVIFTATKSQNSHKMTSHTNFSSVTSMTFPKVQRQAGGNN